MTEPSIARARRHQQRIARRGWTNDQQVTPDALPLADDSIDAAFAIWPHMKCELRRIAGNYLVK